MIGIQFKCVIAKKLPLYYSRYQTGQLNYNLHKVQIYQPTYILNIGVMEIEVNKSDILFKTFILWRA